MPRVEEKMKQRMNDLLETIKTNPGQSAIQLVAYTSFYYGVSRRTIREYLDVMKTAGIIKVDGHGKVYPVKAEAV